MSKIWTLSPGIYRKRHLLQLALGKPVRLALPWSQVMADEWVVGWGTKPNTQRAERWAQAKQLPLVRLEDGFIGYLGHPAAGGLALSLIADPLGIYYDARHPSELQQWLEEPSWFTASEMVRASQFLRRWREVGATKYNRYPSRALPRALAQQLVGEKKRILLVDQIAGDESITGALADPQRFALMLASARRDHPDAELLIRAHPDTLLKGRPGMLSHLLLDANTKLLDADCHPHALLEKVDAVYTVSSLLGFEALLLGKTVVCFGAAFYAGWGLTDDRVAMPPRMGPVNLLKLVSATLIKYCRYVDPRTGTQCEPEVLLELIEAQYSPLPPVGTLYAVGFSRWKQLFIRRFFAQMAQRVRFCSAPPAQLHEGEQLLLWGMRYPDIKQAWRVEDGFIRSVGLGSDLCRPHSLILDPEGIYFNAQKESRLEQLLCSYSPNRIELAHAETLRQSLIQQRLSKYNLSSPALPPLREQAEGRKIVLVVGQVDDDASLLYGSLKIKSTQALLTAVRAREPDAWIVYKPHPDVLYGNRQCLVSEACLRQCVDLTLGDCSLPDCLEQIDELHTITSLAGFEALIRHCPVVVWGMPFYAGWGLTRDIYPLSRRNRVLSLEALIYITLCRYPRYYDWQLGCFTTPEPLFSHLAHQQRQAHVVKRQGVLARHGRKLGYLLETLLAR